MEETSNAALNGLSAEMRRNLAETASSTPRDKENAGANSTQHTQFDTVDQAKGPTAITTAQAAPPAKTPARSRLTDQTSRQKTSPSFFSTATTPSPASASAQGLPTVKESSLTIKQQQQQQPPHPSPATTPAPALPSLSSALKSPPGSSQVLRKHFQSLGFATPPGKHALHQQRLLSSGAVRLTPASRKKAHKGNHPPSMASKRIGFDGTTLTPSKELLKSTASSRNQRVLGLQDISMEHQVTFEEQTGDSQMERQQQLYQMQPVPETPMMDDESSTVASSATVDDASFDMSLPSMNQNSFLGNTSNTIPAPHSPLTPRMGCLNPVALTLLNDGKEDYNYLLTQDTLYPIPKVEDTMDVGVASQTKDTSTSSSCLSPTFGGQSPAEVRATLSQKVRSTLARPVAIMARTGRISPSQAHAPRLAMRPQPKHVR